MQTAVRKNSVKNVKQTSISVTEHQKNKFKESLKNVNNKPYGHKVSMGEYLSFLMSLETPENLKDLKKSTLDIEDELKIFRTRYVEKVETRNMQE